MASRKELDAEDDVVSWKESDGETDDLYRVTMIVASGKDADAEDSVRRSSRSVSGSRSVSKSSASIVDASLSFYKLMRKPASFVLYYKCKREVSA